MNETIRSAIQAKLQIEHHAVFSLGLVKDTSLSVFKKLRIVAITEFGYQVYSKTNGDVKKIFTWSTLKGVNIQGNIAKFIFEKRKFTTEFQDGRQITGILGHIFRQTLPSIIYRAIGFNTYGFFKVKGSNFGALVRMKQLLTDRSIVIQPQVLNSFESFLRFSPLKYNYSDFPEYRRLSYVFFNILPLIQSLSHLTIPIIDVQNELCENPNSIIKLRSVEFFGRKEPKFMEFLSIFRSNEVSKLSAVTFSHSEFEPDDLPVLTKFIQETGANSIGFHNALDHSAESLLFTNILTPQICQNLRILNLDKTRNINLQKVLEVAQNVTLLSLANCNLQISDALSKFSTARFPNLRFLNLSSNPASVSPDQNINIPPQLYSLMLNDIEWMGNSLPDTLQIIFRRGLEPFKLSIARARTPNDAWPNVFKAFASTNYRSLTAFTWDGNPIHKSIFSFLHANSFLDYLSMSGCFHHEIKDSVNDLCAFIDSTNSLKFLTIRGTERNKLGGLTGALLRCVSRSPSILHLDISLNLIGDSGISALRTLLQTNRVIQVVVIDGGNPDNGQQFLETMNFAAQQQPRLNISYPVDDVNYLLEHNKITQEQANNLLNAFKRKPTLKQSKRGCLFETPQNSIFLEPFSVFRHVQQDPFPTVLTDEQFELVLNPPPNPQLPPRPQMQRRAESVKRMPLNRTTKAPLSPKVTRTPQQQFSPKITKIGSSQQLQPPQRQPASPKAEQTEVPFFLQGLENQIGGLGAFDSESTYSDVMNDNTANINVSFGGGKKRKKPQKLSSDVDLSYESNTDNNINNQPQISFGKKQQQLPFDDSEETRTLDEAQVEVSFGKPKPQPKQAPQVEVQQKPARKVRTRIQKKEESEEEIPQPSIQRRKWSIDDGDVPPSPQPVRQQLQRNQNLDDYSDENPQQNPDEYSDEVPQQIPSNRNQRQYVDEYPQRQQQNVRVQYNNQRRVSSSRNDEIQRVSMRKQVPNPDEYSDEEIEPPRQQMQNQRIQNQPQRRVPQQQFNQNIDEYSDEEIDQPKQQNPRRAAPKVNPQVDEYSDEEIESPQRQQIIQQPNTRRTAPKVIQQNVDEYSDEEIEQPKPQSSRRAAPKVIQNPDEYSDENNYPPKQQNSRRVVKNVPQNVDPPPRQQHQVQKVQYQPQRRVPQKAPQNIDEYSDDVEIDPPKQQIQQNTRRVHQKVRQNVDVEIPQNRMQRAQYNPQPKRVSPTRINQNVDEYSDEEIPQQKVQPKRNQKIINAINNKLDEYSDDENIQKHSPQRPQYSPQSSLIKAKNLINDDKRNNDDYDDVEIDPQPKPILKQRRSQRQNEEIPKPVSKREQSRPAWLDLEPVEQSSPPKARIAQRIPTPRHPPQQQQLKIQPRKQEIDEYSDEEVVPQQKQPEVIQSATRRRKKKVIPNDDDNIPIVKVAQQVNQQMGADPEIIQLQPPHLLRKTPERRNYAQSNVGDKNDIAKKNEFIIEVKPKKKRRVPAQSAVGDKKEIEQRNQMIVVPEEKPKKKRRVTAQSAVGDKQEIEKRNEMIVEEQRPKKKRKVVAQSAVGDKSEIQRRNSQAGVPAEETVQRLRKTPQNDQPRRVKRPAQSAVGDKQEISQRNSQAGIQNEEPLRKRKRGHSVVGSRNEIAQRNSSVGAETHRRRAAH